VARAISVAVLGASGPIGLQLCALLCGHPGVGTLAPVSRRFAGSPLAARFPAFAHRRELRFAPPEAADDAEAVFLCLPRGQAFDWVERLAGGGRRLIDVGGDFRLADADAYRLATGTEHPLPELLASFRTVVPEINGDEVAGHDLAAVPGCNATAALLALYPLARAGLLGDGPVVIDSKVGSSGAGGSAPDDGQRHHRRAQGVRPHKVLGEHRHRHEVAGLLAALCGKRPTVLLSTYAVDMVRGISLACYLRPAGDGHSAGSLLSLYRDAYAAAPTVRLQRRPREIDRLPNPRWVAHTGFCDLGLEHDTESGWTLVVAALDNLLKGGAGQAVQAFNLMHGFEAHSRVPLEALP